MIKILFFIEQFAYKGSIAGAEKVLITLVNHMDPAKFDITVQTVFQDEYSRLLNSNIKYKYCYTVKNNYTKLQYRIEAQLGLVYRLRIKDDYDIEVAYLEYATTKVIAASNNSKAAKLAWVHCDFNIAIKDKESFRKKTERQYKTFDKVVFVSDQCKNSFEDIFGKNYDTAIVHNTVDSDEIISKSRATIPGSDKLDYFIICSVTRFSLPKNIFRILKACKLLADDGCSFKLWLIGDGALRTEIESYIDNNELQDYVVLMGFKENPYPYIKSADLLACSSDYEGFSTFITEGLILGKPAVVTDVSGMRELLGDNEYGLITAVDDESFYQGLKRMITDRELLNHYSIMAGQRGHDFEVNKLVGDTEEFLISTLKEINCV